MKNGLTNMDRNMDLVGELLKEIKDSDPFSLTADDLDPSELPGHWDMKRVSYHLVLLIEEGLVARNFLHTGNLNGNEEEEEDAGLRLTWKGHDLLEELEAEKGYGSGL